MVLYLNECQNQGLRLRNVVNESGNKLKKHAMVASNARAFRSLLRNKSSIHRGFVVGIRYRSLKCLTKIVH